MASPVRPYSHARNAVLGAAALVVAAWGAWPANPPQRDDLTAAVDAYLAPLVEDRVFSGVVLIGSPDSIRLVRSYGWADFANRVPHSADTRFRIASLTKTFTAAAVQMLIDRGALALTDSLSRFLPDFPDARRITIRHLLRHESGVSNPDYLESFATEIDLAGLVRRITALPLQFEPGTDGRYSNAGFNLLAHVVAQASGVPYAEFLSREIFQVVGMTRTRMVRSLDGDPSHARGHIPAPTSAGVAEPLQGDIGFTIGSGSLSSTANDLYAWGVAIHRNRLFDLDAQIETDWPYGWGKSEVAGVRGVNQTGAVQGFTSSLAVFDDGTIIVLLLNVENGRWWRIADDLAAIVFDAPYEIPSRLPRHVIPPAELDAYAGHYVSDDRRTEIRVADGHLWLYGGDWPVGKWLVPTAPQVFAIPSDAGALRFSDRGPEGYRSYEWDFGESGVTYRRVR